MPTSSLSSDPPDGDPRYGPFLDEIRRAALAGLRSSALPTASTPASMASKPVFFRSRLLKAWTA